MKIIDSHAHLDHIEGIDQALENADQAGVEGVVTMSIDAESCRKNLAIKKTINKPQIYLAFGMHPSACSSPHSSRAQDFDGEQVSKANASNHPSDAHLENLDECIALIREHKQELTAIGEIGLDFWYKWVRKDKEKKDEQRAVFRALLELAKELDLPAVIHTRGTWRESFETAKEIGITKAEFHWYSGPLDVLKDILDSGYYVSTSPSVAYSPQSREAIMHAPIERTMIETDSPVYYRTADYLDDKDSQEGFQSEPKDVFRTLKAYCELKKINEEDAVAILNRNAKEFFNLD